MRFVISCLNTNRILLYDEEQREVVRALTFIGRNEFDILHSIRAMGEGYLISSSYGVHRVAGDLSRVEASFSLERLSNVHAADPVDAEHVLISNTGWDELILARLGEQLTIEGLFDAAAWVGKPKRLELCDRRDHKRVSASDDWTHLNCGHVALRDGRKVAYSCLFHFGKVIVVDLVSMTPVDEIPNVGNKPHSSIPIDTRLFVCSSADSILRVFDLRTHELRWEYQAPFRPWVRSAWPIGDDVLFTAEKDRTGEYPSRGYVARVDMRTGEQRWLLELDEEGPFDVIAAVGS